MSNLGFDIFEIINDSRYDGRFKNWVVSPGRSTCQCPFHAQDNTPSFVIYHDTNSFYCFGCKVGGGPVQLIQQLENVTYPEAEKIFDTFLTIDKKIEIQLKKQNTNITLDDINTNFSTLCLKFSRYPFLTSLLDKEIYRFDCLLQSEPEPYVLDKLYREIRDKLVSLVQEMSI